MRFLCLHHGDIRSEQTFSGIPLHIMNALESLGHQLVVEGNLQPGAPLIGRIKGVLYKKLLRKTYLVNRDPHTFRRRAVDANRRIRAAGKVDAVVITQIGDAAYIESEAPMITVHDATWFQLLDYYPGYERKSYAKETIDGGIALDKLGLQRSTPIASSPRNGPREAPELDYGIRNRS